MIIKKFDIIKKILMKIIITGSAGYIGSCLFEYLKKYEVFGVDKNLPKLKNKKFYSL